MDICIISLMFNIKQKKKASSFIGNNVRLEFLDELNRKHAEDYLSKGNINVNNNNAINNLKIHDKFIKLGTTIKTNSMFEYPSLNDESFK